MSINADGQDKIIIEGVFVKYRFRIFLVMIFCFCMQENSHAEDVKIKKNPKIYYTTASGASHWETRFDTLVGAFASVKEKYASWNGPNITYEASNVRPEPGYPIYNGVAGSYMWDMKRITPDWTDTRTTREITAHAECDQSDLPAGMQWALEYDTAAMQVWCARFVAAKPPRQNPPSCRNDNSQGGSAPQWDFSNNSGPNADGGQFGNPIFPFTGDKAQAEVDYANTSIDGLQMVRLFHSDWVRKSENENSGLGAAWRHNHHSFLKKVNENTLQMALPGGGEQVLVRDTFGPNPGPWRVLGGNDVFSQIGDELQLRRTSDGALFVFKNQLLESVNQRNGWKTQYAYDSNKRLKQVRNNFGRTLDFNYDGTGKLTSVVPSDGSPVNYAFDANGRLQTVTYADGVTRGYHYESSFSANFLTGISVQGQRFATFSYDQSGLAVSTEYAGGANKYSVSYPSLGSSAYVIDPLGQGRSYSYSSKNGYFAVTGSSAHPATNRPYAQTRTQNDFGLIAWEGDFHNVYTTYQWDTARRLPLSVTEAYGRPEARTTTTTWHADLPLPMSVSNSVQTISYTYDSAGNKLSQSVAETGAVGTARTTEWTYDAAGLVSTETAPNGGVVTYAYDTLGNLTLRTNAIGHVDGYTYDAGGRVLTHTAPNGLVTAYTYDSRGRLLTSSSGGQLTTFTYTPAEKVATATFSHGHSVTYTYDAAHRVTGWSDNRGNSGTYVLDNMGNRTSEQVRNGQGQLAWQLSKTISSMNRVTAEAVGTQSPQRYSINNNGDVWAASNDFEGTTVYIRDGLHRVEHIDSSENARATISYDALDAVTRVSDFNGVVTAYTRDALGNATSESSPDSGSETTQYDALGLPSSITNALGQATTITRDLLGRPTSITHPGGTTTLRYDQTPASKGYLSEIEDASGTTTYQRDLHGRVVSQTQKLINNDTRTLAYSYHATTGLLSSTTYPGGQVLQNVYDATGQLTGLTWAGQPIVSGITWSPLGQPTGWSWNLPGASAAIPATRSYNTAGQLTATEFSSYIYDAAGRITSLTQSLMQPASTDGQASTVTQAPATWTVTYNRAGRITGFTKTVAAGTPAHTVTYAYDANGNRTTSSQQRAGTTTNRTYTLTANRQTGFSQTQTGASTASTSVTYQYNAAGDLLNDGLRTFQYDSQERLEKVTTGTGTDAPSTQYAHNALGQRVFKTEPLFTSGSGSGGTTSGKNLNNLLADPEDQEGQAEKEQDKGFIQTAYEFFTRLWSPGSSDAQKLGFAYVYGTDGTLLGEYGMGGSNSSGTTQYIYLPTANGPMPIAAIVNGVAYAVHSDHLNTPRKLTQPDGQVAWQWAYTAFGDEQPTLGAKRFTNETTSPTTGSTSIPEVTFNLRYPGQYYDKESNLHYNYFRSYSAERGRYTQADPIGLEGGFNRFGYVNGNPLRWTDPKGLVAPAAAACLLNPVMCATVVTTTGLVLADACKKTWDALSPGINEMFSRRPNKETRDESDLQATDEEDNIRCQYCGDVLTTEPGHGNSREFDHERPWSRGGGSDIGNVLDSCRTCNRSKGNKLFPEEWVPKK
ncbi:RHS repeat-associated core domain-containing protein [Acidovorax sp.]|uniref:RHS repeat-associated core domain-containing protein n=1 Tax=Acidovorax sp. TaxID=1872122 RepID=UPI002ACD4E78|nr:RHS repeat-associated core domain-containing protein [Acidovorax sp.]MDZ7862289.1 RHS repeat-associated core domain-containing protein [Acidovorax sp.]